jgi:hypothetical protein
VESELRALGRSLEVPPASDLTAAVRHRLEEQAVRRRGTGGVRRRRGWRAALAVAVVFLVVLIATPQGRAAVSHVFRFAGIELRQGPGPVRTPGSRASLPAERGMTLEQARRQASYPILVPTALGRPDEVMVSDGGRVVSLVYLRTRYGQVQMDEFAGQFDQVYYLKFDPPSDVTQVQVSGSAGLWIKGPHELVYITRDGRQASASARLTTGNTLIWGTRQVAVRLEGNLSETAALTVADSAH